MSTTRRQFLARTAILGGGAASFLGLPRRAAHAAPQAQGAAKKILILGGTGFLGPKTVEAALARGHQVTIFNRGKREKTLPFEFENVEHLYGNRDPNLPADDDRGPDGKLLRPDASPKGLEQLAGRSFDAVIDNSGYYPRMVKASAELLAPNAQHYIYISSISAYADNSASDADETSKLAELSDPTVETMGASYENYGGLKALCERAAEAAFPGRAAIVRPGYIVGPGDPTDRFTYWPVRVAKGGEVLAPGSPDDPTEWIDVRDLGEWLVQLVENGTAGAFNAIGPPKPARWGDVLESCVAASKSGAKLVWVPAPWLQENDMGGEDAFPIWVAPVGAMAGFHRWSNDRAEKAGLRFRPIADTVQAILDWFPKEIERRVRVTKEAQEKAAAEKREAPQMPDPTLLRAGPPPERESELLAKWKESQKG